MRRLLITVVALLGVFVLADRFALHVAEQQASSRLRATVHSADNPTVTFGGFPFLSQVFSGRLHEVRVVAHQVRGGAVELASVTAVAADVRLPLSQLLAGGSGATLRANHVRATVTVSSAALAGYLADKHVRARISGGRVLVSGPSGELATAVAVSQGAVTFSGPHGILARLEPGALPLHLRLTAAHIEGDVLLASAAAEDVALTA